MRRLLLLPTDKNVGHKKWLLVERVVRQLSQDVDQVQHTINRACNTSHWWQITFDNKDYLDLNILMDNVAREGKSGNDQKLFEAQAKTDHQVKKYRYPFKVALPPCNYVLTYIGSKSN